MSKGKCYITTDKDMTIKHVTNNLQINNNNLIISSFKMNIMYLYKTETHQVYIFFYSTLQLKRRMIYTFTMLFCRLGLISSLGKSLTFSFFTFDFRKSVMLINDNLTKDAPQETLLQSDDPGITKESGVKSYIFKLLRQHQTIQITVHCHINK